MFYNTKRNLDNLKYNIKIYGLSPLTMESVHSIVKNLLNEKVESILYLLNSIPDKEKTINEKKILKMLESCISCEGTGFDKTFNLCVGCNGTGKLNLV